MATGLITCMLDSLETSNWSPVWVSGLCPVMDWESALTSAGIDSSTRFLPELISGHRRPIPAGGAPQREGYSAALFYKANPWPTFSAGHCGLNVNLQLPSLRWLDGESHTGTRRREHARPVSPGDSPAWPRVPPRLRRIDFSAWPNICVGRARQWNARPRRLPSRLVSGANCSAPLM